MKSFCGGGERKGDEKDELERLKMNGRFARHIFNTIVGGMQPGAHAGPGLPTLTVTRLPMNTITMQIPIKEGQQKDGPQVAPPMLEQRAERTYGALAALQAKYLPEAKPDTDPPFLLMLGGDHSLSAGSLPAYQVLFPGAGMVYFDAHGDINDWTTSPSWNPHGMPVAVAVGRFDKQLHDAYSWVTPEMYTKQVSYWALRDLDPGEVSYINEHADDVPHSPPTVYPYSQARIDEAAKAGRFDELVADFGSHLGSTVVSSYDVDSLDPRYTPSTGTTVDGGMSLTQSLSVLSEMQAHSRFAALDVCEVNPALADAAGQESTLSAAGIVSQFPALNKTIKQIASDKGQEVAAQALAQYCQDLKGMSFDKGWRFDAGHLQEMKDVVLRNISKQ